MTAKNIALLNAVYPAVPAVQLPVQGGGTATFFEISDTDAIASDVTQGKYFYNSLGEKTAGTNSGGGGSSIQVDSTTMDSYTSNTMIFDNLLGEPTSFIITCPDTLTPSGTPTVASVVFDGTNTFGQKITNTNNAQVSYDSSSYSYTYNNGTLTVSTGSLHIEESLYTLVYTYGGSSANIATDEVQVGSGATSISFTDIPYEPMYFSVVFKSNFGTSSGYQRVIDVVNDGTNTYGNEMDSSAKYSSSHWSYTYNAGTLTISSSGTNAGGYFHQPGYYQLTYAYDANAPQYQAKTATPSSTAQEITADGGYAALSKVNIEAVVCANLTASNIKSGVTVKVGTATDDDSVTSVTGTYGGGGGTPTVKTTTYTNSSNTATSISFTSLTGQPVAWFVRCTTQMQSSSTTYYYVSNMRYNGTNVNGNAFRMGSTRQVTVVTSGYSYTYNNGTLTVSSTGNRTTAPGSFYNGTYELVYVY